MRKLSSFIVLAVLSVQVPAAEHAGVEAEVRDAVRSFNAAYLNDEVDAYFGHYADGALVYFYGARQDLAAYRDEWKEMIAAGGGVEKNELSDMRIQVLPSGEAAVASYFVDYALRTADGETTTAKAFESEVWQKVDGTWKIVNLHYSEIPDGS